MEPENLPNRKREDRPWGNFEQFTQNQSSTIKIITVTSGEKFSLQTHQHRDEFWHVLSGMGTVIIGDTTQEAHAGDEFFIPRGTNHRAEAIGGDLYFLEISFGDFDENDIVRIEDKYGRLEHSPKGNVRPTEPPSGSV